MTEKWALKWSIVCGLETIITLAIKFDDFDF